MAQEETMTTPPVLEQGRPLKRRGVIKAAVLYIVLVGLAAVMIMPLILMLSVSFQENVFFLILDRKTILPVDPSMANYVTILTKTSFLKWFFNTAFTSTVTVLGTLLLSSMAGYAFAKREFPGSRVLFLMFLSVVMIPSALQLVPGFLIIRRLGMINTYWAIILVGMANPVGIFLLKQYIQTLPSDLEEAARIDGCSEWRIFFQIILPLCKPSMGVLAIFTFVNQWNNLVWPLVVMNTESMYTLTVGLATMTSQFSANYGVVLTGAVLTILPILLLFLFFQRFFITGLTLGAIKG